jgi:farnesyl-diphosphate farnesyltransferase
MILHPEYRRQLGSLLDETSRTFALAIPMLPEPRCTEVMEAYLLFRIADTFEDATTWPVPERLAALTQLVAILDDPRESVIRDCARRWRAGEPIRHDGYLRLLEEVPLVVHALRALDPEAASIIGSHTVRTCRGMAAFLRRTGDDGVLRLGSLQELRDYCYVVAGIVGEMLTELFLLEGDHVGSIATTLRTRARRFGEALQLVNVLRDSATDEREGRALVPDVPRAQLYQLARADLWQAAEYTLALQDAGAHPGLVAFNALPVLLASATLDVVEEKGPGSKISRARVAAIIARMKADLMLGRPVVRTRRLTPTPSP